MRIFGALTACVLLLAVATAAPPCTQCSLNGRCDSGKCVCYAPWTGPTCGVMKFKEHAVKPVQGYGQQPRVTSWGGNAVLVDGQYHLFVAEMVNNCTLKSWGHNSQVVHAVASDPTGPYTKVEVALYPWAHNPQVAVQHFPGINTTYALFHIGTGGNSSTPDNCTATSPAVGADPLVSAPPGPSSASSGVLHVATSPDGPWTAVPGGPSCNNPSPWLAPNGTWFLLCSSTHLYRAPTLWGPWSAVTTLHHSGGVPGTYEDAFLYMDAQGSFHVLYHVYNATTPCGKCLGTMVSGHDFSPDGVTWTSSPVQPFGNYYTTTDGRNVTISTRERPKLLFDVSGTPTHLFNGVCAAEACPPTPGVNCKYNFPTFTLVAPLDV